MLYNVFIIHDIIPFVYSVKKQSKRAVIPAPLPCFIKIPDYVKLIELGELYFCLHCLSMHAPIFTRAEQETDR